MDEETFRTHLNTLKEIILDEERLSTYVSISKELCIHVNESKFLMNKAVEEIRSNDPNMVLNVNYVISGLAEDNKAFTQVCAESDIDVYHKRFKVVFFEHIYSVNRGKPLVDKVALMAISRFEDYPLCLGFIKSNSCTKRTSDEICSLKWKSQVSITDQTAKLPIKSGKEEQPNNTVVNGNGDSKKAHEIKIKPKVKEEKITPKKEPIANSKPKQEVKNAKPTKGIAGFFSRSDSASSKKSTKEIKEEKSDSEIKSKLDDTNKKVEEEKMDIDDDVVIKTEKSKITQGKNKVTTNGDTKKKENNGASKNKSKDNNKSLTNIKKNAKVDKMRKRVLHISDSESDEEQNDPFENDDVHNQQIDISSEDEIPPTPTVNTIKISSGMINPRKRRKIVTKTYTDEDGYILTRKEEVYESLSESEDIADTKENINTVPEKKSEVLPKDKEQSVKTEVSPKNKKNSAKSTKKKISPPQKGKQSTLMSFFKKT